MPLRSWRLAFFASVGAGAFASAWLAACSELSPPSGADGADGSTDVFSKGEDGDAEPPTPTELSACRDYILAYCERMAECGAFDFAQCERLTQSCPDYVFAEGSVRTIEGVVACAAVRRGQACSEIRAGITPDCSPPGRLSAGEPCRFVAQCASLQCNLGGPNGCGSCAAPAGDAGCSDEVACPINDRCVGGTCIPIVVRPDLPVGASCPAEDGGTCPPDNPCTTDRPGSTTGGSCRPPAPRGQPCGYGFATAIAHCAEDATCVAPSIDDVGTCMPLRAAGDPCGEAAGQCRAGLFCAEEPGGSAGATKCVPPASDGDPCGLPFAVCGAGLYCDDDDGPGGESPRCKPAVGVGERCGAMQSETGNDTVVACVSDGGCVAELLEDGGRSPARCVGAVSAIGQPCDPPAAACTTFALCNADRTCEFPACPSRARDGG